LQTRSVLADQFADWEVADEHLSRGRYGEAFWRAHHEAWQRSELNQREYCEAQAISLKAFGTGVRKFKAEPQPPARKLLSGVAAQVIALVTPLMLVTVPQCHGARSSSLNQARPHQRSGIDGLAPQWSIAACAALTDASPTASRASIGARQ
jgi:hypothetical protein